MLRTALFAFFLIPVICPAQNVGIGTASPASSLKLHVHENGSTDVSIGMTNNITGTDNLRGVRFRLLSSNFILSNHEAAGSLQFETNFLTRMFIGPTGNIGIGTMSPQTTALMHVDAGTSFNKGLLISGNTDPSAVIPDLGAGSRLMFYPGKAAFRVGYANASDWNNSNVGFNSFGFGSFSVASGQNSFAVGGTASGQASFAVIGTASGLGAIAMGAGTTASAQGSIALGAYTIANGAISLATGIDSKASAYASTALGENSRATATVSTAMGEQTIAQGSYSTSIGFHTNAKGFASMAVGMYNDSLLITSDGSTVFAESPLFIIGNGDDNNNRSNAFVVRKDGKVGVGNIQPGYQLDVANRMRLRGGGDNFSTAGIWFNNVGNTATNAFFGVYDNNNVGFYGNTGAGWGLTMNTTSGNVGIGTVTPSQKLQVVGNICATGTIGSCSDIRYKTNLLPVANALTAVLNIHPIFYNWKKEFEEKGFTAARQIGFSAQEIEKYFPEMVQTDAQGYKAVDYSRMTAVLVEAIKEQQEQMDELKRSNASFRNELNALRKAWMNFKKAAVSNRRHSR